MRLGPAQLLALRLLAARSNIELPPTPRELAQEAALHRSGPSVASTSDAEAMANTLRRLERRHLVDRLGQASTGAWCWRINAAGRAALTQAGPATQ